MIYLAEAARRSKRDYRTLRRFALEGRIPGAKKHLSKPGTNGGAWMVPWGKYGLKILPPGSKSIEKSGNSRATKKS